MYSIKIRLKYDAIIVNTMCYSRCLIVQQGNRYDDMKKQKRGHRLIRCPDDEFPLRRATILTQCICWVYATIMLFAPIFFSTSFCENRYHYLADLAERCCYFCKISPLFCYTRENYAIFSVLHKSFTAFAYRIRAPPSEV